MDKFLAIATAALDKKEFGQVSTIIMLTVALISPSFLFIFIYNRELFIQINPVLMIIFCIIINTICFAVYFMLALIRTSSILSLKNNENLKNAELECNKILTKLLKPIWLNNDFYLKMDNDKILTNSINSDEAKIIIKKYKLKRKRIMKNYKIDLKKENLTALHEAILINITIAIAIALSYALNVFKTIFNGEIINKRVFFYEAIIAFVILNILYGVYIYVRYLFFHEMKLKKKL